MSRICCVSKSHAPYTYQVLKLVTATDGSLDKKVKALVIGSFSPLLLPMAALCDLITIPARHCRPLKTQGNKLPPSIVRKIQNNASSNP